MGINATVASPSSAASKRSNFFSSGFSLAVVANVVWGMSFLASKYTLQMWGPFTASALRFAIAIGAMLVVLPSVGMPINRPRSAKMWIQILFIGLSGFGFLYPLQLAGLNCIPSSLSAAIMLISPLFVLLLAAGFQGDALSPQKLVAIVLGMTGGLILINPGMFRGNSWDLAVFPQLMKGSLLTVGAAFSLAVSVVLTRSAIKEIDSKSLTFWSMLVGELLLIPLALTEDHISSPVGSHVGGWLALVFLALICSVFAFIIWNRAISLTSPQHLASTMHIKTPVAVLLGTTLAGEQITLEMICGAIVVSCAVWLSQWKPKTTIQQEGVRA